MTEQPARDAAVQAVKDHPSTTFMAPYESLADAVLAAAEPLIRPAVLREAADVAESLRQFAPAFGARKAAQISENVGVLRVADELRRLADEAQQDPCGRPASLTTPCSAGDWCCKGPTRPQPAAPQPSRGDAFEQWLKAQRDEQGWQGGNDRRLYDALDSVLDLYRLHADTGTPLSEHVCEGQAVGDCEHMEQQPNERSTNWTPGPVAVAQAADAARNASPTAVLLASRCDACQHTLNWHRNDTGCTVVLCVCSCFQPPAEEAHR